jgi:hypothetical protein
MTKMTKPKTTPSGMIQSRAMLVRLSISYWLAQSLDRKVSDQAAKDFNAERSAGRYTKSLVAQDDVAKIQRLVTEIRSWHYVNTLPWEDEGVRILPVGNYLEYTQTLRKYHERFDAAVNGFLLKYPQLIEEARTRLGGMYDEADYPSTAHITSKFGIRVSFDKVPTGSDFRVDIADEDIAQHQKEIEERVNASVTAATKDLWARMQKLVAHLAEKLSDRDARFKDSIIENLVELVEILPRLNITSDPELEKIRQEVEQKLCSADPKELRSDEEVRGKVADQAQAILDAMGSYLGK